MRDRRDEVGWTPGGRNRPIEHLDVLDGYSPGVRMHVEGHGVAGRHHRDRVVDDRRRRVGGRGDRPDDAVRCVLGHHHAVVAGHHLRLEVLGSRRLRRHQEVLDDLVLGAADPRLLPSHVGEPLAVAQHGGAHRVDHGLACLETHLAIGEEGPPGRTHGLIDRGVDTVAHLDVGHLELGCRRQGRPGTRRELGGGDASLDALDDRLDLPVVEHRTHDDAASRPLWYFTSPATSHMSTIAMMTASQGRSRVISVCRAELPEA